MGEKRFQRFFKFCRFFHVFNDFLKFSQRFLKKQKNIKYYFNDKNN